MKSITTNARCNYKKGLKQCKSCKEFLDLSKFTYKKGNCKKCRSEIAKTNYQENEKVREYHIKYQNQIGNPKRIKKRFTNNS